MQSLLIKLNNKVLQDTLVFVFLFGITALIAVQVITMERPVIASFFFVSAAIFSVWCYRKVLEPLITTLRKQILFLLALPLCFHFLTYYALMHFIQKPDWRFDATGTSWLLVNEYFAYAIPLNVLLQQILITGFCLNLKKQGLKLGNVTMLFVLGFGLTHVFQVLRLGIIIGLIFTAGAIALAFLFPRMMYHTNKGYISNFSVHLLMYDVAALFSHLLYQ